MHKIFFVLPVLVNWVSYFFLSRFIFRQINIICCAGRSWNCVCVFTLLSFHIYCFCFTFILVQLRVIVFVFFYLFWLLHILIFKLFLHHPSWWWRFLGQFSLGFWWCFHLGNLPCLIGTPLAPIFHMSLLQCFSLFSIFSNVIIVLVSMCWRYCIVFILGFIIFVYDLYTWVPLKNWIPLGHLWLIFLSGQVVCPIYYLIVDGQLCPYESVELFHGG